MSRSRLVALGLSVGAAIGLVAGMAATARPQAARPAPAPIEVPAPGPGPAGREPAAAEPPSSPFTGKAAITQTGAS